MNQNTIFPIQNFKNTIFLKPYIKQSDVHNVHVGEYSYYSDFEDPTRFLQNNVLYNFGYSGNSLYIGKFCAIAHGVKLIMADANHATAGISSYPFAVFGSNWSEKLPISNYPFKKYPDTVIGNDVWIGLEATILPGVTIGNGAIIGAKAVVSKDIPAYSIAVGNPAKVIKWRYTDDEIAVLEKIAWWDWEIEKIKQAIPILVKGDIESLLAFNQNYRPLQK